ncbi:Crp/Fnr family transcriptional regulator [Serpentinicella alkaliphila]|uniref:CRP-like cAMP-binding protein n=1 Tax=Serpentinicella alkaliphila TaxID=1734049 RepID=A0A4V2T2W3_9FIRM|nr:Crp/Fnr family transcriptional regulator [Serpentinicella alkaliphila]QUH24798.1 Crp/Fnr family transcriptional regulator [Serpentinicella alkaliphila]TCP98973.1 CRP-like cAMP-binding protein [Serpentinicella alkaliphila]
MNENINVLTNCILFNHLSFEELKSFLSNISYTVKSYKKNEMVFSPNRSSDTLGIILTGSVDVQKIFASGKAVTVSRRYQQDLIAEASIFANIDCYPSTVVSTENSNILLIEKSNLLKLFTMDERIMTKFLESVSNRILALNSTIEILSLNSVPAKISYFLLLEQKKQNSNTIQLKFTKKTLAEHINVSRPTLSRELKNMQLKGMLSFTKKTIEIHSSERLEDICAE